MTMTKSIASIHAVYVVQVARSYPGSPAIHDEYLTAIRYDRYQTGEARSHSTSRDIGEAFPFQTRAAAEVAAVFVGGDVVLLVEQD